MTPPTRAEIQKRDEDIAEIRRAVEHIEEVVITGNGEPALRETVRKLLEWQVANKDVPELTRTTSRWVGNVNKLAFVVLVSAVGVTVPMSCGLFFGVVILLYNNGLFKIP